MKGRHDPLPHDLLERADIAEVDARGSGKPVSAATPTTPSTPIFTGLPTARYFPVDALPVGARRFVKEASTATGCPPDLVAVPMLAMLSAGVGASRVVRLKRTWSESAALFLVVVAPPGSKKTPAQKLATEPIWDKQSELMTKRLRQ